MRLLRARGLAELGKVASGYVRKQKGEVRNRSYAGKQKSGISGSRRTPKPTPCELRKSEEEEGEEENPTTKRKREYTDLGEREGGR